MKRYLFIALVLTSKLSFAQDPRSIVQANEKTMEEDDQEAVLSMQLISKSGIIRERTLIWSSRTDKNGRDASYICFTAPADIKGTAFLTLENSSGADDQWLYLPVLKRSRRISSNEKGNSFMGTDFSYEDIGSENSQESTYTLLKTEKKGTDEVYILEALYKDPKKSKETGYSKRILYISKSNYLLTRADFYGPDGKLIKTLSCSDFQYYSNAGKWRPNTMVMKDVRKGSQTILSFSKYSINKGIDPEKFTVRYLESND